MKRLVTIDYVFIFWTVFFVILNLILAFTISPLSLYPAIISAILFPCIWLYCAYCFPLSELHVRYCRFVNKRIFRKNDGR